MVSELIKAVNHFIGKFPSKATTSHIRDINYRSYNRCFLSVVIGKMRILAIFAFDSSLLSLKVNSIFNGKFYI